VGAGAWGEGAGGPAEIHPHLGDKDIFFGALRVTAVDRKGTRAAAQAYLEFLYTPEGQDLAAQNYYRPRDAKVALESFHTEAGFSTPMIALDDASPDTIAKIGAFISSSVSSTSSSLGTGGPSQNLGWTN
jgi:ABC-type Fe3+ transport system substrate-binding protein